MPGITVDNKFPRRCPMNFRGVCNFHKASILYRKRMGWYDLPEKPIVTCDEQKQMVVWEADIVDDKALWVPKIIDISLEELQLNKIAEMLEAQNNEIESGFDSSLGFKVRCTNSDLTMFSVGYSGAVMADAKSDYVWDYDRIPHEITIEQYKVLGAELRTYIMALRVKCSTKIAMINAAKTADDVIAITWEDK